MLINLKINNIDKVVLLGGGHLLLTLARWFKSEGELISVITAPRHAAEQIENGSSLDQILTDENIPFINVADIVTDEVTDFLGDLKKWILFVYWCCLDI